MVDVLVVLCVYVMQYSCTLLSLFDYIYIETVGQGDQRHTDSVYIYRTILTSMNIVLVTIEPISLKTFCTQ